MEMTLLDTLDWHGAPSLALALALAGWYALLAVCAVGSMLARRRTRPRGSLVVIAPGRMRVEDAPLADTSVSLPGHVSR